MSDVILHGVLNMPIDMWIEDPIDQIQRHSRYLEASRKIRLLEGRVALMGDFIRHIHKGSSLEPVYKNKEFAVLIDSLADESKQVFNDLNEIQFNLKPPASPELFGPMDVVVSSISDLDVVNVLAAVSGMGRHSKLERGGADQARNYLKSKITELASALSLDDLEDIVADAKRAEESKRIA